MLAVNKCKNLALISGNTRPHFTTALEKPTSNRAGDHAIKKGHHLNDKQVSEHKAEKGDGSHPSVALLCPRFCSLDIMRSISGCVVAHIVTQASGGLA